MKRSVLLPLLAVSVLVSSSAFAADDAKANGKLALAKQQDGTNPAAQPAAPAGPSAGSNTTGGTGSATITLGGDSSTASATTSAAAPDQPQEEKKEEKSDWVDKFAGSSVFTQTSANLNTFAPRLQPDRNVTVDQWTRFAPRYALSKDFQLRGLISFNYEFTDSDSTTYNHEAQLSDTSVSLFYRGIPAFYEKQIKVMPFVNVGLPTSKASQAQTMLASTGAGVQGSFSAEHVLGGEFAFILSGSYSRRWYKYTTPGRDTEAYAFSCYGGDGCSGQVSGTGNVRDTLGWLVIVSQEWGKWSPGAFFSMTHAFPYGFREIPGVQSNDSPGVRNSTYFSAWLDYHLNDWLTPELGYQMPRRLVAANGKYGNPIFSEYQDMRVYLGATIQLDSLIKTIRGDKAEAGVVRAKNNAGPIQF